MSFEAGLAWMPCDLSPVTCHLSPVTQLQFRLLRSTDFADDADLFCPRFGGDFCLATHYWEIDDRLAGMLDAIIAHADRAGVEWVPADELFAEPSPMARVQPTGGQNVRGRG